RNQHRQSRHDRVDPGGPLDSTAQGDADHDSGDAAHDADQDRFGQELKQDLPPGRADRSAHADLLDPLEHRREHDVHDPDAADDERDRRDRAQYDVEDRLGALLLLQEQLRHRDLEVDYRVVT